MNKFLQQYVPLMAPILMAAIFVAVLVTIALAMANWLEFAGELQNLVEIILPWMAVAFIAILVFATALFLWENFPSAQTPLAVIFIALFALVVVYAIGLIAEDSEAILEVTKIIFPLFLSPTVIIAGIAVWLWRQRDFRDLVSRGIDAAIVIYMRTFLPGKFRKVSDSPEFQEAINEITDTTDKQKAKEWVKQAQDMGVNQLPRQSAPPELIKVFRNFAENDNTTAQSVLGAMYTNGWGVPQDYREGYIWFSLSSVTGDARAIQMRDMIAKLLSPQGLESAQQEATKRHEGIRESHSSSCPDVRKWVNKSAEEKTHSSVGEKE